MNSNRPSREKRQWWAVDDDNSVTCVTGYSCDNSPSYWWVPELHSSMAVGFSLFETEREALDKAIEKMEQHFKVTLANLGSLKLRRANLYDRQHFCASRNAPRKEVSERNSRPVD